MSRLDLGDSASSQQGRILGVLAAARMQLKGLTLTLFRGQNVPNFAPCAGLEPYQAHPSAQVDYTPSLPPPLGVGGLWPVSHLKMKAQKRVKIG